MLAEQNGFVLQLLIDNQLLPEATMQELAQIYEENPNVSLLHVVSENRLVDDSLIQSIFDAVAEQFGDEAILVIPGEVSEAPAEEIVEEETDQTPEMAPQESPQFAPPPAMPPQTVYQQPAQYAPPPPPPPQTYVQQAPPPPPTMQHQAPPPPAAAPSDIDVRGGGKRFTLEDFLQIAVESDASDLHISVTVPPTLRLHGRMEMLAAPPVTMEESERLLLEILTPAQKAHLAEHMDLDFAYEHPRLGRFRASIVKQRLGYDGVFRYIKGKLSSFEDLGLPETVKKLTEYAMGMVLVTGPCGSGKSTTLAMLVDAVNDDRQDHIITMEDPIEFLIPPKQCQVSQREIGTHSKSFGTALRAALREDPDVIMIGELRDLESISLAITAAETGHLVFGTLHTSSASRTMDRILDAFPPSQQSQIRTMVSESIRGVVTQFLIPRIDRPGRALALEIMMNSPAISNLIREGRTFMIPGTMQTGKKLGMRLMDESLVELTEKRIISPEDAYERADNKDQFGKFIKEFKQRTMQLGIR